MQLFRLMSLTSKFIDVSYLGGTFLYVFVMLLRRSLLLLFLCLIDITCFVCKDKNVWCVTVLFSECPLLTFSEIYLLQVEI